MAFWKALLRFDSVYQARVQREGFLEWAPLLHHPDLINVLKIDPSYENSSSLRVSWRWVWLYGRNSREQRVIILGRLAAGFWLSYITYFLLPPPPLHPFFHLFTPPLCHQNSQDQYCSSLSEENYWLCVYWSQQPSNCRIKYKSHKSQQF